MEGAFAGNPRDGEGDLKGCALFRQQGSAIASSNWRFGVSYERRFISLKPVKSYIEDCKNPREYL